MHVHPRIIHHRQPKGGAVAKMERLGDAQRIPGAHEHRHGLVIRLEHLGNGVRRDAELQVEALHKNIFAEYNIPVLDDPLQHESGVLADKSAVFQMMDLHRDAGALRSGQPVNRILPKADDRRGQRFCRLDSGLYRRIIVRRPVAGRTVGLHLQYFRPVEPLILLCQNHRNTRPFLLSIRRPAECRYSRLSFSIGNPAKKAISILALFGFFFWQQSRIYRHTDISARYSFAAMPGQICKNGCLLGKITHCFP